MEWLGWTAAIILVVTLFAQVRKNLKEKRLKGVNPMLYYGQAIASLCFTIYSISIGSIIFVITNSLVLLSAMIGIYLVHRYR
ncbi:MAG TPA: PQ-loop domain-containing transporter [Blastocatellia bacterium]|nr:PQ-loop domain-containing transporter [Blastocatellia bacterium]